MAPPIPRWLSAALASAALVAAVTAVIALLEPRVPALGLGVLYLLAVVPIALMYGLAVAGAVSVASMAAFTYFFLPPRYSLDPGTSERWEVLVAFLVSSLVVSQLAARSQREVRRAARLADEQAALRRVATLVARGVPPPELFAAVAREVGLLLGVDATHMGRYEPDGTATVVGAWSRAGEQVPIGTRVDLEGESVAGLVFRTGRPARIDDYEHASGPTAALSRELGMRSSVGAPIVVDQRLWGVMIASTKRATGRSRRTPSRGSPPSRSSSPRRSRTPRREHRSGAARRRAGRVAARRDAGRARDVAGGAVRGGRRGGRAGVSRRERGPGPLRVRRHDDDRRDLGRVWLRASPSAVGGRWGGRTSARSSRRPAVRPGSTAMAMPPGRSVSPSASGAWTRRSGRRSSSRAASGV